MYKPQFFFNISNHPSAKWAPEQRDAALELGQEIVDTAFPYIPPTASYKEVRQMAEDTWDEIYKHGAAYDNGLAVHIAGEPTFVGCFLQIAEEHGAPCYTATTERVATETVLPDGTVKKETVFKFVQWRPLFSF